MNFAKGLVMLPIILMLSGCLTPATLKPVAAQNEQNIKNYNANVSAMISALKREAEFHRDLEIQRSRNDIKLVLMRVVAGHSNISEQEINDPDFAPRKALENKIKMARAFRADLQKSSSDQDRINSMIISSYPVVGEIVTGNRGFDIPRIIRDAAEVKALVVRSQADNVDKAAIRKQKNSILDAYQLVQSKIRLSAAYEEALDKYSSLVLEQGKAAKAHADSISAYAESSPDYATIPEALSDKGLQDQILSLIGNENTRKKVGDYLAKAGDIVGIVEH